MAKLVVKYKCCCQNVVIKCKCQSKVNSCTIVHNAILCTVVHFSLTFTLFCKFIIVHYCSLLFTGSSMLSTSEMLLVGCWILWKVSAWCPQEVKYCLEFAMLSMQNEMLSMGNTMLSTGSVILPKGKTFLSTGSSMRKVHYCPLELKCCLQEV